VQSWGVKCSRGHEQLVDGDPPFAGAAVEVEAAEEPIPRAVMGANPAQEYGRHATAEVDTISGRAAGGRGG